MYKNYFILQNSSEKYTIEFIDCIQCLSKEASTQPMLHMNCTEKEYLENLVKEARELIKYNEWFIALENLLENLYEVGYKIDKEYIEIAKNAIKAIPQKKLIEKYNWLDKLIK